MRGRGAEHAADVRRARAARSGRGRRRTPETRSSGRSVRARTARRRRRPAAAIASSTKNSPSGVGVEGLPTTALKIRTGRPSWKIVTRRAEVSTTYASSSAAATVPRLPDPAGVPVRAAGEPDAQPRGRVGAGVLPSTGSAVRSPVSGRLAVDRRPSGAESGSGCEYAWCAVSSTASRVGLATTGATGSDAGRRFRRGSCAAPASPPPASTASGGREERQTHRASLGSTARRAPRCPRIQMRFSTGQADVMVRRLGEAVRAECPTRCRIRPYRTAAGPTAGVAAQVGVLTVSWMNVTSALRARTLPSTVMFSVSVICVSARIVPTNVLVRCSSGTPS